jgi:hypothetical protein
MKILLISHFFPPIHNAATEKRTFGYTQHLLERGHRVQVLCAGNYEKGTRQYWNGCTAEIYEGVLVRQPCVINQPGRISFGPSTRYEDRG